MICTNTENVLARKDHDCHSCGEAIEAGQTYKRWACFDNGSASTVKMHPECYDAHQAESDYGTWEFTLYGHPRGSAE
jgi:predicted RNA-binding Zn-ribbon protein involved in translation (DUF1610 family)